MTCVIRVLVLLSIVGICPVPALADTPPAAEPTRAVATGEADPLTDASFLAVHQPGGAHLEGSEVSLSDEEIVIVILGVLVCVLFIAIIV